jgi:hypothetical protein
MVTLLSFLVLAPPNTGKTLTTMMACMERGADFLAEDLAITDGKQLYSVPWTSTFRYYEQVDNSRWSRALNRATQVAPILELLPLGKTDGIDTLVNAEKMVTATEITHIVILERGAESVQDLSREEAKRKALNLNRYEFNYLKSPTLVAYEFFNPQLSIDRGLEDERRILDETVDNAIETLVVKTPDATRYVSMILDHLDHASR